MASAKRGATRVLARFGPLPFLIIPSLLIFAWGNPRFISEANIVNIVQQGVHQGAPFRYRGLTMCGTAALD
jgi:hypothetical protein